MKRSIITWAALSCVIVAVHGQGLVQFNNRIPGVVDARVVLPDGSGAGAGWTAQLYAGPEGGALKPVSPTTTFRTTSAAARGFVEPIEVAIPGVAGGARATIVMRAYNGASFETSALRYESNPVTIALGGGGVPPSPAAPLVGLAKFTQVSQGELPAITVQPLSQTLVSGTTVTFRVEASGTLPLSYQWRKNDVPIPGATSATLTLNNVTSADVARYNVVISNAAGSITSQDAFLSPPTGDVDVGTVTFNNYVPGVVDAKVVLRNGTPVSAGWTAQLYGGPEGGNLSPLLPTATFRAGVAAGYVNPVTVNVTGVKPSAKATLVMRVFNGATFENSTVRFESNPFTLALGGGTLPPVNLVGLTRFTEVGGPAAPSFVVSVLPSGYAPGGRFLVTLKASPSSGVSVYAVEDLPPANWVVGKVSDEGKFDSNTGKVKFGPFFDSNARNLTYEVTPPARETGEKVFSGSASADGVSSMIAGDRKIDVIKFHPADNNPGDLRITINEATAYGAAWRKGATWPSGPNPIPIDYVTRAGTLWKNGEAYTIDSKVSGPPLWWVNSSGGNLRGLGLQNFAVRVASQNAAVGMVAPRFVPTEPLSVELSVEPHAGVSVYAVEEAVPPGCTVRAISDGGEFDEANGRVKWGPYYDNAPRHLRYELATGLNATDVLTFVGNASFDGGSVPTIGQRQSQATSRLGQLRQLPNGQFQIPVNGRKNASYLIEVSANLEDWTPLGTVPNLNGTVNFVDPGAAESGLRFYRAVAK